MCDAYEKTLAGGRPAGCAARGAGTFPMGEPHRYPAVPGAGNRRRGDGVRQDGGQIDLSDFVCGMAQDYGGSGVVFPIKGRGTAAQYGSGEARDHAAKREDTHGDARRIERETGGVGQIAYLYV